MARFIMLTPIVGAPPSQQYRKWPTATTVADTSGNALAGDVVWPALCASPSAVNLAPLDAAAQALIPGSQITTLAAIAAKGSSGFGASLDAGD